MIAAKPPLFDAFGNLVSGGSDPDLFSLPLYMDTGFPAPSGLPVVPELSDFNWLFFQTTNAMRYQVQRGIADWDVAEDGYATGATVQGTDGNIWRLLGSATTGTPPQLDQGNWAPDRRDQYVDDVAGGGATSFDGSANPTTWNDLLTASGSPVSGLDILPTFAAASGFAVTVGAGRGNFSTSVGLLAEESTYRRIYWATQNLTISNPDATHPRYDAITVTPSAFGTPSVLAVVAGTPSSSPVTPAIPSGSGALFFVYVPSSAFAPDSTHFRACRGLWRRVGYPWSGMSAIISGCELSWNYTADPASASAGIFVGAADQTGTNFTLNRILIDGEPIEWAGWLNDSSFGVVQDATGNPFGSPASSSFDRPYYIYAVGGRHNPMPSNNGTGLLNPITVCESTVPPNPKTGRPTTAMAVNGVTVVPNGAVYLGLGFVVQGTTLRRGCLMDAEMTYAMNPLQTITHAFSTTGLEDIGTFSGGATPAISTKMVINALYSNVQSGYRRAVIFLQQFPVTVNSPGLSLAGLSVGTAAPSGQQSSVVGAIISFTPRTGAELWATAGGNGDLLYVGAMGFNHRVNRICVGY